MSYISGSVSDYASRLHQLPTGSGDYVSFITEGNGYGFVPPQTINQWEREIHKGLFNVTHDPTALTGHYLTGAIYPL